MKPYDETPKSILGSEHYAYLYSKDVLGCLGDNN